MRTASYSCLVPTNIRRLATIVRHDAELSLVLSSGTFVEWAQRPGPFLLTTSQAGLG